MPWGPTCPLLSLGLVLRFACGPVPSRLVPFGLLRCDHFDAAAGLLDGRDGRLRGASHLESELGLDLALAQQAHAITQAPEHAGRDQRLAVDSLGNVETAGIDRLLQAVEIDLDIVQPMNVVEAALGHAHVERHLAAFEAVDGHARSRRLAFAAPAGGLALARADAPANAHARLAGARIVGELIEPHGRPVPYSTRTRWRTLLIMPRTADVSSSSRLRRILLSPRPMRVCR